MKHVSLMIVAVVIGGQQNAVFRSSTSRVGVHVSVYSRNSPVSGLSASDFSLTDNGVEQTIEAVAVGTVPVDVSVVVDVSGSTSQQIDTYRRDIARVSALLRPVDRMRLIAFETSVSELLPLASAPLRAPVANLETGRTSSVYDGIVAALLRKPAPGRPHLILVYTDGVENRSILNSEELILVSRLSEGVLHVVAPNQLPAIIEPDNPCRLGVAVEAHAAPAPRCSGPSALERAVETTGGRVHFGSEIVGPFKKILGEYLNSYLLFFSPTQVAPDGWHDLSVKVRRSGTFTVHARRGYMARR